MSHWLDNDTVGFSATDFFKLMAVPGSDNPVLHQTDRANPVQTSQARAFGTVLSLLKGHGFPPLIAAWAAAQAMLESRYGTSNVATTDKNFSGIKWDNHPYQSATRGLKSPEGNYYAHYVDLQHWADDFRRVLSSGSNPPINATSPQDFVNRLKAHGYFTSDPKSYYNGLASILKNSDFAAPTVADQDAHSAASNTFANDTKDIPSWVKWAFGGLAGIIVLKSVLK